VFIIVLPYIHQSKSGHFTLIDQKKQGISGKGGFQIFVEKEDVWRHLNSV
jgi:hypothetical protein